MPAEPAVASGGGHGFVDRGFLAAEEDRVALLADYWNVAAVATYRTSGFCLKPLAAAHQVTG